MKRILFLFVLIGILVSGCAATKTGKTFAKASPTPECTWTWDCPDLNVDKCEDNVAKFMACVGGKCKYVPLKNCTKYGEEQEPPVELYCKLVVLPNGKVVAGCAKKCTSDSDCHYDAESSCTKMCEAGECVPNGRKYCSDTGACPWISGSCPPLLPTPTATPSSSP